MPQYEFHPWANTFPMLDENELRELAEDIAQHGLRHPILLAEGKIADGRNRYRACELAGVPPRFAEWDGNGSLLDAIVSDNLKRRHLDAAQRGVGGDLPGNAVLHEPYKLKSGKKYCFEFTVSPKL